MFSHVTGLLMLSTRYAQLTGFCTCPQLLILWDPCLLIKSYFIMCAIVWYNLFLKLLLVLNAKHILIVVGWSFHSLLHLVVFISVGLSLDYLIGYGLDLNICAPQLIKYDFPFSLFLEEFQALWRIALVAFGASGDLSPSGNWLNSVISLVWENCGRMEFV